MCKTLAGLGTTNTLLHVTTNFQYHIIIIVLHTPRFGNFSACQENTPSPFLFLLNTASVMFDYYCMASFVLQDSATSLRDMAKKRSDSIPPMLCGINITMYNKHISCSKVGATSHSSFSKLTSQNSRIHFTTQKKKSKWLRNVACI